MSDNKWESTLVATKDEIEAIHAQIENEKALKSDDTPKLYVGTYAKYNDGSIFGAWLDLTDYCDAEDFYSACAELHKDESDPEFMFQDFENFPKELYSESGGVSEIYEYIDFCDESYLDKEAIEAGMYFDIPLDKMEEAYYGQFKSDEEFAEEFIESTGTLDGVPDSLKYYFDYERYARDLMMDFNEHNKHYFWSNY